MQFNLDISNALTKILEAEEKVRRGIEVYGQTAGLKLEARAKKEAPWTDRTGNARQTIKGISGWNGANVKIELAKTGTLINGRAETRITSVSQNAGSSNKTFVVGVAGNMEYSPSLELRRGKKNKASAAENAPNNYGTYAILWPTLNEMQGEIIRGFANMMNRLK